MGLSRQEYWSGLPFPPPRDLPDPRIEPTSPALAGRFFTTSAAWKALEALKGPYSGTSGVTSSALMRGSLHHEQVWKHKPSFYCVPPAPAEARLPSCPDQNSSLMPEMFQDMLPQNMSLWCMDYFKLKAINPQLWEKL